MHQWQKKKEVNAEWQKKQVGKEKEEPTLKLLFNQLSSYPEVLNKRWSDYWDQVCW